MSGTIVAYARPTEEQVAKMKEIINSLGDKDLDKLQDHGVEEDELQEAKEVYIQALEDLLNNNYVDRDYRFCAAIYIQDLLDEVGVTQKQELSVGGWDYIVQVVN